MNSHKSKKRLFRFSGGAAILLLAFGIFQVIQTHVAHADVRLWTGAGGNSNFSTPGNWSGGVVPQNGDSLVFDEAALPSGGGYARVVVTNDLTGLVLNGISFVNFNDRHQGFEITGNDITISGSIETDDLFYTSRSTVNLINVNLTLNDDLNVYNVPIGNPFGTRTLTMGAHTLTMGVSAAEYSDFGIKSNIVGSGLIHYVTGDGGRMSLNGNNAGFTGTILVEPGVKLIIGPQSAPNASLLTSYGDLWLNDLEFTQTLVDIATPMALSGTLRAESNVTSWLGGSSGDAGAGVDFTLSGGVELLGNVTYYGYEDYLGDSSNTHIEAPFRPHQYSITDSLAPGHNGVATSDTPIMDTAPGAPTGLTATPSSTQIALSWTAPASDGGGAITDYQVQYKLSTASTWTTFNDGTSTATNATITGLSNGVRYDVRVAAVNWVGPGSYATATNVTMPATVAGAPTGLTGTPSSDQVALSWTAPANDGNAAITDYIIEYKLSADSTWTNVPHSPTTTTNRTITGLSNGQSYDFRVAAVNSVGNSAYATLNNVTITVLAPGVPQGLSATPYGSGQAELAWSAPASNGGAAITDYLIQYKQSSVGTWTTFSHTPTAATAATIPGLANGVSYDFRVAAVNSVGPGGFATVSNILIPAVVAGAPQNLVASPAVGEVSLDWDAPASNGGAAITDYRVEYKLSSVSTWTVFAHAPSGATARTVTGLSNGQTYDFRVSAVNTAGTGSATTVNNVTVAATVATAPRNLTVTPADEQASLTWNAPLSNGGSTVTDYLIEYKLSSSSTWTTFTHSASTATNATITGLTNGETYDFRVGAVNGEGTSPRVTALNVLVQDTVTTPSAPSDLEAYLDGDENVVLTWTAPASNGGASIGSYVVEYSVSGANSWQQVTVGGGTTSYTFSSYLTEGVTYDFRVSAQNSAGTGSPASLTGFAYVITPTPGPAPDPDTETPGAPNTGLNVLTQNIAVIGAFFIGSIVVLGFTIRAFAKKR